MDPLHMDVPVLVDQEEHIYKRSEVIYWTFCLDAAQDHMNVAPNETQTHLWRFASLACEPLYHLRCPNNSSVRTQDVI